MIWFIPQAYGVANHFSVLTNAYLKLDAKHNNRSQSVNQYQPITIRKLQFILSYHLSTFLKDCELFVSSISKTWALTSLQTVDTLIAQIQGSQGCFKL